MIGRAALAVTAALLAVPAAEAYIPPPPKVAQAVAVANEKAGRSRPLRLDVVLRNGLGEEEATGEALLLPRGEVTLELRRADGSVERHRLVAGREWVDRDGRPQAPERSLLAPFALVQVSNGEDLLALLGFLGGAPDQIDLGLEGSHDCYVLGGRGLPRLPGPPAGEDVGEDSPGDARPAPAPSPPPPAAAPPSGPGESAGGGASRPSLWVDTESFDPVRIDRGDGVRFRFGPLRVYQDVRFPSTVDVEAPGRPPWRLEIRDVTSTRVEGP